MSGQTAQAHRQPSAAPASATTTVTSTPSSPQGEQPVLQLRGERASRRERPPERRIRWAENVVNNEGMGKKKSKVCCIYHKPREVGESSSEDSDSSSSDSDSSDNDDGAARLSGRQHPHQHEDHCAHTHGGAESKNAKRKSSPNAYEKQPKSGTDRSKPAT